MSDEYKPWWIWRTHPTPRKRLEHEFMLPWPYLQREFNWSDRTLGGHPYDLGYMVPPDRAYQGRSVASLGLSIVVKWIEETYGRPLRHRWGRGGPTEGMGSMSAVELVNMYFPTWRPDRGAQPLSSRAQRRDFLLTPPLHKFCELSWDEAGISIGDRRHPYITFYVQPEVFEATGELMIGSPADSIFWQMHGIDFRAGTELELPDTAHYTPRRRPDAYRAAPTLSAAGTQRVMAALDSFLERGGVPDPRFLVPAPRGRSRAPRSNPRTKYKFATTEAVLDDIRDAEPTYEYIPQVEIDHGEEYAGRKITWVGSPGLLVKIPVKNILFMEGNSWYPGHAAALVEQIESGELTTFEVPIARVHRVTARDVKNTEKYQRDGELEYQTALAEPWTRAEVGEYYAQLTDGNHRAAAAMLVGEPFIYVYVVPNSRDEVRQEDFE